MAKLDQFFKDNQEKFDHRTPREDLWNSIELPKKRDFKWLKIAASVLIIAGISSLVFSLFPETKEMQTDQKKKSQHELVQSIQNLELRAPNGDKVILVPAKNTFTLIQFWASTDKICTEESCYYFKPIYEKYRDKGFEIYAVSLDDDKADWVHSIETNELSWIHVSDLKGFDSPVCTECNIASIPSSYLIDTDGNVVATNIDAHELEAKLAMLYAN